MRGVEHDLHIRGTLRVGQEKHVPHRNAARSSRSASVIISGEESMVSTESAAFTTMFSAIRPVPVANSNTVLCRTTECSSSYVLS